MTNTEYRSSYCYFTIIINVTQYGKITLGHFAQKANEIWYPVRPVNTPRR